MTDIMKLADDYARAYMSFGESAARAALQSAIEALQGENEQFRLLAKTNAEALGAALAERDALQAKLSALQTQEPVAVVDANDDGYWADILPDRDVKVGQQLFAAPKALEPITDERQPLTKVLAAVREYLPPDGITAKDCLSKIIAIVDPWPLNSKPLIAMKDVELSLMAHNDDPGDWNDLRYRDCWHEGYKAGARATEASHGITKGTP